ncbi:MAG: ABC transporter ATP-binding protein [Rudaea sp.]
MIEDTLLRLEGVGRALAGRIVVDDLNLTLDRGTVLGVLGVNGAGKSTTLKMICGILSPSAGRVLISGADFRENPRTGASAIGYLPEQPPLYAELRVEEYLSFCARLRHRSGTLLKAAVNSAIDRCGLGDVRHRLLGNLSKGFQQRAGIAQAIVHDPSLIVLDEPSSGLDPLQSSNIRSLIRELGKDRAVILSTHLIADVNQCCDRVAILHRGKLRYDGPVNVLADDHSVLIRIAADVKSEAWTSIAGVESAQFVDGAWRIARSGDASIAQLSDAIVRKEWGLLELRPQQASLEQVFLRIASADDVAVAA